MDGGLFSPPFFIPPPFVLYILPLDVQRNAMLTYSSVDHVDLLHNPRIHLRPPAAPPPPPDHRPNSNRLLLPAHARLLPRLLHIELDMAGT